MTTLFNNLEIADYEFLLGLMTSDVSFSSHYKLQGALSLIHARKETIESIRLDRLFEQEIRYLGSADIAYFTRQFLNQDPGVPLAVIIHDVAKSLKVRISQLGKEEDLVGELARKYATREFLKLGRSEQQSLLLESGLAQSSISHYLQQSTKRSSLLVLNLVGADVLEALINKIIIFTVGNYIGQAAAKILIEEIARKFPWWRVGIGPIAWAASVSWTVFDLQGPAKRKTVPIILYLGACSLRGQQKPQDPVACQSQPQAE